MLSTSFPLFLSTVYLNIITISIASTVTEVPFQNVAEFSVAAHTTPHCVTACAIDPSDVFKTKYGCDVVAPFDCICGNGTRTVELKSSIASYCYDHCGWEVTGLATTILDGYCWTGSSLRAAEQPTTTAPPTTTNSLSTSTSSSQPTTTPTTSKTPRDGLSAGDIAGIVSAVIGTVLAAVTLAITIHGYRRDRREEVRAWPPRVWRRIVGLQEQPQNEVEAIEPAPSRPSHDNNRSADAEPDAAFGGNLAPVRTPAPLTLPL